MKNVQFSKEDEKTYNVDVDGENYGKLVYDYERDDEDHSRPLWILWPADIDDAVSYSDDLDATEEAIIDELNA